MSKETAINVIKAFLNGDIEADDNAFKVACEIAIEIMEEKPKQSMFSDELVNNLINKHIAEIVSNN